ncbi:MAG: Tn3 family transposase [Ferruginibacter sp.]
MRSIQDTAYPRLRSRVTALDLAHHYTPTADELALAKQSTRGLPARVGFLILLKAFQRLGAFPLLAELPLAICTHIARAASGSVTPEDLQRYDASGTRGRHLAVIRAYLQVQPYGHAARRAMLTAMVEAARSKDDLADLINIGLEELVRQRFELPVFPTLESAARHARALVSRTLYAQVVAALSDAARQQLLALLDVAPGAIHSPWERLKADAGKPTLKNLREWEAHLRWLDARNVGVEALQALPAVKVQRFAAEARTLDAARMRELSEPKRLTLLASLVAVQAARVRDELAEMFVKRMARVQRQAREALATYRKNHAQQTDHLVATLREVVTAHQSPGTADQRLAAIDAVIGAKGEALLAACDAYIGHSTNSHFPFLWNPFKDDRAALFRLLGSLELRSTTEDTGLEEAVRFLLANQHRNGDWLDTAETIVRRGAPLIWKPLVDLSWIPDSWWRLLSDLIPRPAAPRRVRRRMFEVCVCVHVFWALKAGNLAVVNSDNFADYRQQLVDDDEFKRLVAVYGEQVELPTTGAAFVAHWQQALERAARTADQAFPANQAVTLENGEPRVSRPKPRPTPPGLRKLEKQIASGLGDVKILDVLTDTDVWLQWTRCFGPVSGHAAKLSDSAKRYLLATLCYGCQIGASQLARALGSVDRRQLGWVHLRHITEEALDNANRLIINAYHRFALPGHWGDGHSVAADGTKWDLYEQNLMAEYHIRYGGYGGIGYYHVSDTYIALFSHFIPCGVWEAVYILDGLLQNTSDIQPDTVHADTHGQNEAVFGLAALLGIKLMPRIRNWKHLTFYRPSRDTHYEHLDELFTDTIDWGLIATHLPDMLRVVVSIKAGRIVPSTILRRLSTYNQQNTLYQAFRELGRVVRTIFLLEYLGDEELRVTINAATNKNESFNRFVQWLAFGGDRTITENDRDAQRKLVKYNHLVANCVIFYNVFAMSRVMADLERRGEVIHDAALAALSPYITSHINRLGHYEFDRKRRPPELDFTLFTRPAPPRPTASRRLTTAAS